MTGDREKGEAIVVSKQVQGSYRCLHGKQVQNMVALASKQRIV